MKNQKIIVSTVAVVVAAVVGYVAMGGWPPKTGTEGAIGAANRYQSPQIADQDVSLDDARVATFIQSDTFRKLASDSKFREAARSETFNKFVASENVRSVSAQVDLGRVLGQPVVQDLFRTEQFGRAVQTDAFHAVMLKAPELFSVTESARIAELLGTRGLSDLAKTADFQRFAEAYVKRMDAARGQIVDAGRQTTEAGRQILEAGKQTTETGRQTMDAARSLPSEQLALTEYQRLIDSFGSIRSIEALKSLEGNRWFADALAKGFMNLFVTREMAQFTVEGLKGLIDQKSFIEALKIEGFSSLLEGLTIDNFAVVRDVSSSDELRGTLSNAVYREAAKYTELSLVASAGLEAAVQRIEE
jgi:hypothetical protein